MNHHYADIRDKLGAPQWWDEYAVPRYCDFAPNEVADIYADEAVLLHIDCQSCGAAFKVAMSASAPRINWVATNDGGPTVLYPTLAETIETGELHYGDPPNANCCAAGPTMNSVPRAVLEFWRRTRALVEWERVSDLERNIEPDWASS